MRTNMIMNALIILLGFAPMLVSAAVAYDNSAFSTTFVNQSSITYPMTVGSGSNRQLVIFNFVSAACGNAEPTVSSVTFDGVALTKVITEASECVGSDHTMWTMPAGTQPASGTHDIVVTLTGTLTNRGRLRSNAMSFINVHQTTTFSASPVSATGSGTALAVTIGASGANDLVINGACTGNWFTGAGQTQIMLNTGSTYNGCDNDATGSAVGGTTSQTWTSNNNDHWSMIGAALKAAGATPVALDATAFEQSTQSITYSLTVGSGINRGLIVFASRSSNNGSTTYRVLSITYAGVALEKITGKIITGGEHNYIEMWSLPAGTMPTSGTNIIVVTFDGINIFGSCVNSSWAMSVTGLDQATTVVDTAKASQINTTFTAGLAAGSAGDMPIMGVCAGSALVSTTETSHILNTSAGTGNCRSIGLATGASGDTSMSWTQTSSDAGVFIGAVLKSYVKVRHKVSAD
jgi:hypothetical protein